MKVTEKFEIYELLSVIIPGTLLVALIPLAFPSIVSSASPIKFPEGFGLLVLVALAVFFGHIIQAVASLIEPFLFWIWGGRPSDIVFTKGLGRYMSQDTAKKIKESLKTGSDKDLSDSEIFLFALQSTEGKGRVSHFNALYAYFRSLWVFAVLIILLIFFAHQWGIAKNWTWAVYVFSLTVSLSLLLLINHRAKQRAIYYVREVLLTARQQSIKKTAVSTEMVPTDPLLKKT